ncbi:MAG: DUF5011 domain-containing protein [Chitinophagaceae bacterium]|nr:MAG: DUF5011 domain-containing protein [Chitinophagaceae bacterium]
MKKFLSIFLAGALLLGSCKKDDPVYTEDRVGISRVTRFPNFTMNGDQFMSILVGGTYTEAGVTATEGGSALTVATSGTVDPTTVGVYDITYSATNKDGFAGSVTRTVAVLPAAEQPGVNIAGRYQNIGSFPYVAQMDKRAPGLYYVDNIWGGGSGAIIPAYVITVDGQNLIVPETSLSSYGGVVGTGTLDAAGNAEYRISLLDQGVSNSLRKWKKL